MKKTIIILVSCALLGGGIVFLVKNRTASSQQSLYDQAVALYQEQAQQIPQIFGSEVGSRFNVMENDFFQNKIANEIRYLNSTQPFYNEARMYTNVITARTIYIDQVIKDYKEKKEITRGLRKFMETGDIKKVNEKLYVAMLNVAPHVINKYADKNDLGIISSDHVYCNYTNWTDVAEGLASLADGLAPATGKLGAAGDAASIASMLDNQSFTCRYWGELKKYAIGYFYTNKYTQNKYFTQEKIDLQNDNDRLKSQINGIKFSTFTAISNLDYISIRLDFTDGKKEFYVFTMDKQNEQLIPCDPNEFLQQTVTTYKEE